MNSEYQKATQGFSLFEVIVALGVFAISVLGLAIALDSSVQAALEARERAFARMQLDSRLSACLADPPMSGRRVIEARDNQGVRIEETLIPYEAKTTNNIAVTGLWKLKILADWGQKKQETAEIILYKP
jgi:prepilin-type N-terminal cleavage/methylation domain-containing protein